MQESIILFYCLLFMLAFLYASVGHGGASGYLALMALYGISPMLMKPTALMLNLFVSGISFIQFYRGKHFVWKLFWPLALSSIPLAFIGGLIDVDDVIYKKILGLVLLFPIIRFLVFNKESDQNLQNPNIALSLCIGTAIGFLSGLMGIGGGIILSPILLLLKWSDIKQTAAISAMFIFVNSLSGLAGQLTKGISFSNDMYFYVGVAFLGGILGAYFGSHKMEQRVLKIILALVLLVASVKLLFT